MTNESTTLGERTVLSKFLPIHTKEKYAGVNASEEKCYVCDECSECSNCYSCAQPGGGDDE